MFDFSIFEDDANAAYIKTIALETVINFVARSISQSDFRIYKGDKIDRGLVSYKLNVRPNPNQSASTFWRDVIYRLLKNNEVLVIESNTHDLLIADTWTASSSALYPIIFSNVTVSGPSGVGYTYYKSFSMDDVWYLSYSNSKLSRYINDLGQEIGKLYERIMQVQMRNGQIRGTVDVKTTASFDKKKAEKLQTFINKIYKSFKTKSVAVVPQQDGMSYTELTNTVGVQNQSSTELKSIQDQMTDTVANLIGVPPALIHGENEKLDSNIKSYLDFCLTPLIETIQDELNAKLFTPNEYARGRHVQVVGLNKRDLFSVSEAVDKLISSSGFNPNEVRKELGYEPREGGDEFVLTKNYVKGGETNENNPSEGTNRE
jgi:HK97 family phage portal protein